MANEYHELITFIGADDELGKLELMLGLDRTCDDPGVTLKTDSDGILFGSVHDVKRSPTRLFMAVSMRNTVLGAWFPELSAQAPGLFMTSSAHCIWDNRYYLIGGFGGEIHFLARPPMFGPDYEEIPGISGEDPRLLKLVWAGFGAAGRAAIQSRRRGASIPRKAIRTLVQTQAAYLAADPPPDEVFD